jgi:hypothetical protein
MRKIPIETLQPAKVFFEGSTKNIAICASKTLFADAIANHLEAKSIPADSLVENILFSLKTLWEQAPGYENSQFSVYIADEPPVNSDFDITVYLEKLQITNKYYGQQYDFFEWEAYIYVVYIAKWLIYYKSGEQIDAYTKDDMIVLQSGIYDTKAKAVESLPDARDAWWDLGIVLAQDYITRVTPQWQKGTRYIYMVNKFPELSMLAYRAMETDNYVRAFDIWETMLMSCRKRGQKQTKSQIIYNMAIACEFQNYLEQAVDLTEKSASLKQKYITGSYLKLLKNRQEYQSILDRQFN